MLLCFSFLGLLLWGTHSVYEDTQREKKSPVTKTKNKQTNVKAVGRRLRCVGAWYGFRKALEKSRCYPCAMQDIASLFFLCRKDKYMKSPAFQCQAENTPQHIPSLHCPCMLVTLPPCGDDLGGTSSVNCGGQTRKNRLSLQ